MPQQPYSVVLILVSAHPKLRPICNLDPLIYLLSIFIITINCYVKNKWIFLVYFDNNFCQFRFRYPSVRPRPTWSDCTKHSGTFSQRYMQPKQVVAKTSNKLIKCRYQTCKCCQNVANGQNWPINKTCRNSGGSRLQIHSLLSDGNYVEGGLSDEDLQLEMWACFKTNVFFKKKTVFFVLKQRKKNTKKHKKNTKKFFLNLFSSEFRKYSFNLRILILIIYM